MKIGQISFRNDPFRAILLFSIILHIIILSQINWKLREPDVKDDFFEIELLRPETPKSPSKRFRPKVKTVKKRRLKPKKSLPEPKKRFPEPPKTVKSVSSPKKPPPPPVAAQVVPVVPVAKPSLSIRSELTGSKLNLETPKLTTDDKKLQVPRAVEHAKPVPGLDSIPDNISLDKATAAKKSRRVSTSAVKDLEVGQVAPGNIKGETKTDIRDRADTSGYKIADEFGDVGGEKGDSASRQSQTTYFEGEIRKRKVIFKPKPPELNIERDVTVTLKFTVLPNGEVDQIFPFRKAAPELERVAMEMLRQYRFEPLFENDVVQRGVIHFTIHRKK
ncbi:MAG: energy transducer TonB [Proteobacteria bacterium]|nr:energy transducer TonB [Pseudomonadota bacterium]